MTERRVEHAAVPVYPAPGYWIVAGRLAIPVPVERQPVEAQQPVNPRALEAVELVDLVIYRPNRRQRRARGMRGIVVEALGSHLRSVRAEFTAQHRHIRREFVKGVGRRVRADESLSAGDPVDEPLLVR